MKGKPHDCDSRILVIGDPWPGIEGVKVEEISGGRRIDNERLRFAKTGTVKTLLILSGTLLVTLTVYGMFVGDSEIIDAILALIRDVMIAILGWAIGRYGSR